MPGAMLARCWQEWLTVMPGIGPAPNPQSRKQTSGAHLSAWIDLPANGYRGPIPKCPLYLPTKLELSMWRRIWRTPHAAAWSRYDWTDDVAMYVRLFLRGTADPVNVNVAACAEARQWSDRLGLNPQAMLRNRWRIPADEIAIARGEVTAATARRTFSVPDDVART